MSLRSFTLIHAFVTSRLDYCYSLLYGLPKYQISKLQRVQNTAARLITNTRKYDHITPALYSLHWLPVFYRIHFKILIITFKAIYNIAPSTLGTIGNSLAKSGRPKAGETSVRSEVSEGPNTSSLWWRTPTVSLC